MPWRAGAEASRSARGLYARTASKKALAAVSEAAKREKAELIVVGNPLNMNGSAGPRSEKCRDFAAALEEETGIETVLYDERLTTVSAHRYLSDTGVSGKKRKESVDELSATLILQDYIDRYPEKLG